MSWLLTFALGVALLQGPSGAIATFSGIFKSADRKYATVMLDNGEAMRMFITGRTKFIRNGRPSRPADFHEGDPVDVDAERDVRMNMIAIRVELKKTR